MRIRITLRIFCHGSSNVEKNKRQCGDKITGYKGLFLEFIQKPRQTQQEHNSELVIKISPPKKKKNLPSMDQEGVRKGNGSPKADNKSSQTSQKGEGTGRK